MVPFQPALTEIIPNFCPTTWPFSGPHSLQTFPAVSVEVASCAWCLFSQSSRHLNLSPGAEGKAPKGCFVSHHLISFIDESHYRCFMHLL